MNCTLKNCANAAAVTPKLCVPYQDLAREGHYPYKLLIDLPLCLDCFPRVEARQLIRHDIKKYIIKTINQQPVPQGMKMRQPDFDRAWLEQIDMGSEEYQNLQKAILGGLALNTTAEVGGAK